MVPSDLRYTREHEWVRIAGNRVTVGITDFAQEELGDVVFVDLPAVGEKVQSGAKMASIESVKAISDVFAPLTGEIMEINEDLEHSPEFVNQDPYSKGWIAVIEPEDPMEVERLLTPENYEPLTRKG